MLAPPNAVEEARRAEKDHPRTEILRLIYSRTGREATALVHLESSLFDRIDDLG